MSIRTLLVHDYARIRKTLRTLLEEVPGVEVIGIIEFDCSGQGKLGPFLTHRFVDAARRDQELVRIVLLGTPAEVLADIGQARLDQNAFKAIGH